MSVSIKGIYECPRCYEAITTDEAPETCPNCSFGFSDIDPEKYVYPTTLQEQHLKLKNNELFYDALLLMPIEKANDIMNDALNVMQTIAGKNTQPAGIREMIKMGLRIGNIAKKYEDFLHAGGKHVPGLYSSSSQGDQHESKKNGDREKSS